MPLLTFDWNQRSTPSQCCLIVRAASITAGNRLRVAQKYRRFRYAAARPLQVRRQHVHAQLLDPLRVARQLAVQPPRLPQTGPLHGAL